MQDLILYGAGYPTVIKLIHAVNREKKTWNVIGFIDDTPEKQNTTFMGYPVLGNNAALVKFNKSGTVFFNNVFATPGRRRRVAGLLAGHHITLATLIHPSVNTEFCLVGTGAIISEGVILGANVVIGDNAAVRDRSVISHDCHIGDFTFIAAHVTLCGHVTVGPGVYIGAASVVRERMKIGTNSVIGTGSVVVKPVPADVTVMGVPAQVREKGEDDENQDQT